MVRSDWMKEFGLEMPETIDEILYSVSFYR